MEVIAELERGGSRTMAASDLRRLLKDDADLDRKIERSRLRCEIETEDLAPISGRR